MTHLLIAEIKQKEEQLLEKTSLREKFFYQYLTGGAPPETPANIGDIDRICAVAFGGRGDFNKAKGLIEKSRNVRLKKGIHFSNNLIAVCGFSLLNDSVRKDELVIFFKSQSLKEQFLIAKLFGEFVLEKSASLNPIEQLIDKVHLQKNPENAANLIFESIKVCDDIVDLYIITDSFKKLIQLRPNRIVEDEAIRLAQEVDALITTVERHVNNFVNVCAGTVSLIVAASVIYFTISYWVTLDLEPLFTGISIAAAFILFPIGIYFYSSYAPNNPVSTFIFSVLDQLKQSFVERWFTRNGVNADLLKDIIQKLKRTDGN